MLLSTALVSLSGFAAAAIASPLRSRQSPLQPWTIEGIGSFSPSGRPGSYPWATITVYNLTDPNTLVLGNSSAGTPVTLDPVTVPTCQAKWITSTTPFNHIWPCDNVGNGYFTLEILENDGYSLANFQVKITRVAETIALGSAYSKKYEATATFKVPDQLGGSCGGSGVCSWGLKDELSPYAIQQSEVS